MVEVSFWVHVLIWLPPIGGTLFTIWYYYMRTPSILKRLEKK